MRLIVMNGYASDPGVYAKILVIIHKFLEFIWSLPAGYTATSR